MMVHFWTRSSRALRVGLVDSGSPGRSSQPLLETTLGDWGLLASTAPLMASQAFAAGAPVTIGSNHPSQAASFLPHRSSPRPATSKHRSASSSAQPGHSSGSNSGTMTASSTGVPRVAGERGSNTQGLCFLSRLGQYKRRQLEQHKQRVAEKELDTLHHRIVSFEYFVY